MVRRLAFGLESRFVRHLGYHVAGWDVPNHLGLGGEALMYNVPGKLASVGGHRLDRTRATTMFVFTAERLDYDRRDLEQQQKLIADAYTGVGWEVPVLLESLSDASEFYFDSISRVDPGTWSQGRVALVGDAACGATLGGMGTGTVVVAAYVLAGELAAADGDQHIVFAGYEQRLRRYAQRCQQGGDLAPRSRMAMRLRNRLLSSPVLLKATLKQGQKMTSAIELPDYGA